MSEKSNTLSAFAAIISGFLTILAAYLSSEPMRTIFAVLFGAAVTYFYQNWLQTNSEKRAKNREYVEKFYGPLLLQIENIKENFDDPVSANRKRHINEVSAFRQQPQYYSMGIKFRTDYEDFLDKTYEIMNKVNLYRNKIKEKMVKYNNAFNSIFDRDVMLNNVLYDNVSPIFFQYNFPFKTDWKSLEDCILIDTKPIDLMIKNIKDFQEDKMNVILRIKKGDHEDLLIMKYSNIKIIIDHIYDEIKKELMTEHDYVKFKDEFEETKHLRDELSKRLIKYVQRYISTVNI